MACLPCSLLKISVGPKSVGWIGCHWLIVYLNLKFVMFPLPSDEWCLGVFGFDFSGVFVVLSLNRFHNWLPPAVTILLC